MEERMTRPALYTHNGRAIVDVVVLQELARRSAQRKEMVMRLNRHLDTERTLLRTALHELAIARGENPVSFIRHWQQKRREIHPYEDDA